MFALGIPVLPWAYLDITGRRTQLARKLVTAIIALCVFEAAIQLVGSAAFINKVNTLGTVSGYLRSNVQPDSGKRMFSDEGTVIALSGLPESTFVSSAEAPHDRDGFIAFLSEKDVGYVVYVEKEDSTLSKLFPELGTGIGNEMFQPVMHARARFLPTNVWVYRMHVLYK
jgi:hypothetical protein